MIVAGVIPDASARRIRSSYEAIEGVTNGKLACEDRFQADFRPLSSKPQSTGYSEVLLPQ